MNNIQKIISELEDEKIKADKSYNETDEEEQYSYFMGQSSAFILCIEKLTLLLNAETQATVKKPEA